MEELVTKQLTYCIACQAVKKNTVPPPIQSTEISERVNMLPDYMGPLPSPLPDGKYTLSMVDHRSRYPIVEFTTCTNPKNLIRNISHFKRIPPPDATIQPTAINIEEEEDAEQNHICDRPVYTTSLNKVPQSPDKNRHRERNTLVAHFILFFLYS